MKSVVPSPRPRPFLLAAVLGACLGITGQGRAAGEKPGPPITVTVATANYTVDFTGDRAWTLSRILHQGETITGRKGFYGTVFSPEGGRWIGTGHNEGGIEKIEKVTLTVDGKPCEFADQSVYRGSRAELRKTSMLGPIRLEAVYVVTDEGISEEHRYEVTEAVKIGVLYGFMHPFVPATTEWIAEKGDGTLVEGVFESQDGHPLSDDVKWTALYDPTTERATVIWYPEVLSGQGLKTFYWDKTVYHKLYNQLYSHAAVPAGTRFEARVILRSIASDSASWKERAKGLAKEIQTAAPRDQPPGSGL